MLLKNKALFLDGFNGFYRCLQTVKTLDENAEPNGAFVGFVSIVRSLVAKFKPSKLIIVFDGPGAGQRRRSLYPQYKEKRGRRSRTSCVEFSNGDKEYINNEDQQLQQLYTFLKLLPVDIVMIPYCEADDIIAYLVEKNKNDYANIIVSTDKDFLQLINEDVYVYSPVKKILFTSQLFQQHYNILPQNITYVRSIVGDVSDHLEGVKGVNIKTITKVIPEIKTKPFNDFWEFWSCVEQLDSSKSKKIKVLKEGKERAHLMYRLMKLQSDNLSSASIDSLKQQINQKRPFSKINLKLHCIKDNIQFPLKEYDFWISPFSSLKPNIELNA